MRNPIQILVFCFFLTSCHFAKREKKNNDTFYTSSGGLLDRPRIPLLKPYELLRVNDNEWRMELQSPQLLTLSIHNVKGVSIKGQKIFIYSKGGTEVKNKNYDEVWFVIDPIAVSENALFTFKTYTDSLSKLGLTTPHLVLPEEVYKLFVETGKINW